MENLQNFLLTLQIFVAIVLIAIVILQKTDEDSLSGIGGNSNPTNSAFSNKSSVNILTKITFGLILLFMINCLVLATVSKTINKSISDKINSKASQKIETDNQDNTSNNNNQGNKVDLNKNNKSETDTKANNHQIPQL